MRVAVLIAGIAVLGSVAALVPQADAAPPTPWRAYGGPLTPVLARPVPTPSTPAVGAPPRASRVPVRSRPVAADAGGSPSPAPRATPRAKVSADHTPPTPSPTTGWYETIASSYGIGDGFLGGHMACGGRLDDVHLTVAEGGLRANGPILACGTRVEIALTRPGVWLGPGCVRAGSATTCTVKATVTDRGPYVYGRGLDLGPAVARAIHLPGLGRVRWRIVG